jgi:hypothetical protein
MLSCQTFQFGQLRVLKTFCHRPTGLIEKACHETLEVFIFVCPIEVHEANPHRRELSDLVPPFLKGGLGGIFSVGATGGRPGRRPFAPTIPLKIPLNPPLEKGDLDGPLALWTRSKNGVGRAVPDAFRGHGPPYHAILT